ncbi:unnamed protein product [Prorocentrum cordatum]|uniref:Uncharacterized protein n=1 Tax=Prorocentrum cordatum TaxID=2364126 RepID=A0ABN9S5P9_9DINO|nr:unnamed protein product [Polarella glacialis]
MQDSSDEEAVPVRQEATQPAVVGPAPVSQEAAQQQAVAEQAPVRQEVAQQQTVLEPAPVRQEVAQQQAVVEPAPGPQEAAQQQAVDNPSGCAVAAASGVRLTAPIVGVPFAHLCSDSILDQGDWHLCSLHACASAAASALAAKCRIHAGAARLYGTFLDRAPLQARWPGALLAALGPVRIQAKSCMYTVSFSSRRAEDFSDAAWAIHNAAGWRCVVLVAKWPGRMDAAGRRPTHAVVGLRWDNSATAIAGMSSHGAENLPYPFHQECRVRARLFRRPRDPYDRGAAGRRWHWLATHPRGGRRVVDAGAAPLAVAR